MKHGVLGGTRSYQIVFFLSIYWKAYFEERVICCRVHEREKKINFAGLRFQGRTKEEEDERERERGGVMYVCMCEREKSLKSG